MNISTKDLRNVVAALFTLSSFYATSAVGAAACTTLTPQTLLNLPDMTVRHDTPIGAEIGTAVFTGSVSAFSCTKGFDFQEVFVKGVGAAAEKINGLSIYKFGTEKTGIGYAVYGKSDACGVFYPVAGTIDAGPDLRGLCSVNGTFGAQPMQSTVKLVFYKIGTITAGKKTGQAVAEINLRNNKDTWQAPPSRISTSELTVRTMGCSVNKPEIDVPLGDVEIQRIHPAGSTLGEREFSIPLNCDIGTKVKMTLSAGTSGIYDNAKGLINLANATATETAQGVKIQILSNDAPVTYDKALEMGTQTSNGIFTIPLTARYYRTAEPLKAGIADSSVTYTITYE